VTTARDAERVNLKILFAGPPGAGKTTAIAAVSDIQVVGTEVRPTDELRFMKSTTTVAMDYGILKLDDSYSVHLYGTPGQRRFDFMWDVLAVGALGLVLLLNHEDADALDQLRSYVDAFESLLQRTHRSLVVGVTRLGADPNAIDAYRAAVLKLGMLVPVFDVDARHRADVRCMLLSLAGLIASQDRVQVSQSRGGMRNVG